MMYGRDGITIHAFPVACHDGRGWGNFSARMPRYRSRESSARRFLVFFRTDNRRWFAGHRRLPWSSEPASGAALFLCYALFHARGDFFVFQHFTAVNLRQALFDLTDEPFVVTHEPFDGLVHQRLGVTSLLSGKAVKLRLEFRRKVHLHAVSVGAGPHSCLAFSAKPARGGVAARFFWHPSLPCWARF